MPTYLYRCVLGHEFEAQQSIKDEPLESCSILLGGLMLCKSRCRRVIQPVGVILKGGGWAKEGYSSAPAKKEKK